MSRKLVTVGTHRSVQPDETWKRVSPFLADMGITRVSELTGLDVVGIPVFQATRPNGRVLSVSQGKGITAQLAKVSAVMEAIETWHAEEATPAAAEHTVAELAPMLPYSVFDLPQPPRSVLSPATRLRWVQGQTLGASDQVWLPESCVIMDNTSPDRWSPPLLQSNSNGLASGNTVEEALLHGLYELLERDARARAQVAGEASELDLSTVTGSSAALLDRFARADVWVRVHDLTALAGQPCYETLIFSAELPVRFGGWGCHHDPDVALARALTEAAQSRLTMIAGSRDDLPSSAYRWMLSRPRLRAPFAPSRPSCSFPPASEVVTGLDEDLLKVTTTVKQRATAGVYWVNLTHPDFGIPVVQVIAPGLQMIRGH
ncbi:YcaO-like family protein [Streptomyces sp. NPDC099088]|uniref:YcaO-like family protein n=1 Tax=Streptomyces sp. NPDC099088 TaxID=3366101 RepID=UPI00382A286B